MVCSYVSIYSIVLSLDYNKNKLYKTSDCWSRDTLNFDFLRKVSGNSFTTRFCVWLFKKNVFCVIIYYLSKFHWLIVFISWDIGHSLYCSCLFSKLWRHKSWDQPYLPNQFFFYMTKNSRQKLKYLRNEKSFYGEIKSIFHPF